LEEKRRGEDLEFIPHENRGRVYNHSEQTVIVKTQASEYALET
jgi:hypothetical protein